MTKLEIGKIYGYGTIPNHVLHNRGEAFKDARFMVIRESTEKEYKDYYFERYGVEASNPRSNMFYEVSID